MHHDDTGDTQKLDTKIAVRDRVKAVFGWLIKAKKLCGSLTIDRIARSSQSRGSRKDSQRLRSPSLRCNLCGKSRIAQRPTHCCSIDSSPRRARAGMLPRGYRPFLKHWLSVSSKQSVSSFIPVGFILTYDIDNFKNLKLSTIQL